MKSQPIRTCLGCRRRFPKEQLRKYVLNAGMVMYDSKGSEQGRSAYCCDNKSCLGLFFRRRKKLSRAFRVQDNEICFELKDRE